MSEATATYVKGKLASERLGLSSAQLRRLDEKGLIKTIRTNGGTRLYDVEGYIADREASKLKAIQDAFVPDVGVEKLKATQDASVPDVGVEKLKAIQDAFVPDVGVEKGESELWKRDVEAVFKAVHDKASNSDNPFPICFAKVVQWIGFSRKDVGKAHLVRNFDDKKDYEICSGGNRSRFPNKVDRSNEARTERIFVTPECFKALCMTVNTPRGKLVRRYYLDLEERLRNGDLTLAGEVVQNYDERNGTTTNVLLKTSQSGLDGVVRHPPAWVPEWRDARSEQKNRGKTLREVLKEMNLSDGSIYSIIENMHNQGVLGFEGTTRQWRKDNGIPENQPLAEVMDKTQLDVRRMMSIKLIELFSEIENPTAAEIKRVAEGVKAKTAEWSSYIKCNEYRPTQDEKGNEMHIGKRVRQLEAIHRRSVKRLATLERKQKLLESVPIPAPEKGAAKQMCIGDFFKA